MRDERWRVERWVFNLRRVVATTLNLILLPVIVATYKYNNDISTTANIKYTVSKL
jgi:hypothetical protein